MERKKNHDSSAPVVSPKHRMFFSTSTLLFPRFLPLHHRRWSGHGVENGAPKKKRVWKQRQIMGIIFGDVADIAPKYRTNVPLWEVFLGI